MLIAGDKGGNVDVLGLFRVWALLALLVESVLNLNCILFVTLVGVVGCEAHPVPIKGVSGWQYQKGSFIVWSLGKLIVYTYLILQLGYFLILARSIDIWSCSSAGLSAFQELMIKTDESQHSNLSTTTNHSLLWVSTTNKKFWFLVTFTFFH